MAYRAPGKHFRHGISTKEFFKIFPDDETAEYWFIAHRWPDGIRCPYCGSDNINTESKHKTMPYRCRKSRAKGCGKDFSTKTGTFMQASNIGYQDWLFAMYLLTTSLKSVSSMKLHRDLGITQKSAWHLAHRIRKSWSKRDPKMFFGPVEADETYVGGKRQNMPKSKRKELDGRGPIGKTAVVGIKDRATNKVSAVAFPNSRMILKQVWVGKGTEVGSELLSRGFRCGDGEGGGGLRGRGKLCRVVLRARKLVELPSPPPIPEESRADRPVSGRCLTSVTGSPPAVFSCVAASAARTRCRSSGVLVAREKRL